MISPLLSTQPETRMLEMEVIRMKSVILRAKCEAKPVTSRFIRTSQKKRFAPLVTPIMQQIDGGSIPKRETADVYCIGC